MKNKLTVFQNRNLEGYLSAIGILIVTLGVWMPVNWKTPDLNVGWLQFYTVLNWSWFDVLFKPAMSRYLVLFPWKLGFTLVPTSFLGIRLIMAFIFWAKSMVLYALLRKLRLAPPYLAFFISIVFMLYPADQGIFMMGALGRQFAVLFFLLAIFFMVLSAQNPQNKLWYFLMLLSLLVTGVAAEQGFPLLLIAPAILFLDRNISKPTRRNIMIGWYIVLFFCAITLFVNIISPPKSGQSYQANLLLDNTPTISLGYLWKVVYSNLSAYGLFFYGGWKIAINAIKTAPPLHIYISALLGLCISGIAYLQNRLKADPESEANIHKYFWAVMASGMLLLALSFLPYSITIYESLNFRVFYYAAIGGAMILGYLIYIVNQRLSRWNKYGYLFLFGLVTFLISVNGLDQHSKFEQRALIEERVLMDIMSQAPKVKSNTKIILLTNDLNPDFVKILGYADDQPFRGQPTRGGRSPWFTAALNVVYRRKDISGVECATSKCLKKESAEQVILFQYTRERRAKLLDQVPDGFSLANQAEYDPYARIESYAPFLKQQFHLAVTPDPAMAAPLDWRGVNSTMNDRRVCDSAHEGKCSLLFYDGLSGVSFTQTINITGHASDRYILSFWTRSKSANNETVPLATLTVFFTNGTSETFPIDGNLSTEWTRHEFEFTCRQDCVGLQLILQPETANVPLLFDDVSLNKSGVENELILNSSFEK